MPLGTKEPPESETVTGPPSKPKILRVPLPAGSFHRFVNVIAIGHPVPNQNPIKNTSSKALFQPNTISTCKWNIYYILYIHRYIHTSYINIIMLTTIINIFLEGALSAWSLRCWWYQPSHCPAWVWKDWPYNAIGSRWWNTNMVDFYIIPSWQYGKSW